MVLEVHASNPRRYLPPSVSDVAPLRQESKMLRHDPRQEQEPHPLVGAVLQMGKLRLRVDRIAKASMQDGGRKRTQPRSAPSRNTY